MKQNVANKAKTLLPKVHGGELTAVLGSKGSGKRALLEVFQSILRF